MRRAARKDSNHADIADGLREDRWNVFDTSRLGDGFPDLAISREGIACLVEIKDGTKPPSARKLTVKEEAFRRGWEGNYIIATSLEDARQQLAKLIGGA